MYCSKCGKPIPEGNHFCSYCGTPLENIPNNQPQYPKYPQDPNQNQYPTPTKEEKEKKDDAPIANTLSIVELVLMFLVCPFCYKMSFKNTNNMATYLILFCFTAVISVILMVYTRINYPNNKLAKIVMWIFICLIVLALIIFIVIVVQCYITCTTMDTSGCG